MTIKALYPTIEPSLELDFANTKALDPRITFTRASTGTFVGADGLIKTAGNGVARFDHDPVTGASLGLLVEEARTNYALNSNNFSASNWTTYTQLQSGSYVSEGDSYFRVTQLTNSSVSGGQNNLSPGFSGFESISQNIIVTYSFEYNESLSSNTSGGWQFWYRPATGAGTVTSTAYNITNNIFWAQKILLANGWIKYYHTFTMPSNFSSYTGFYGGFGSLDNVTGGYYAVRRFQVEAGAFPTSYIPTVASTVTRAADVASVSNANSRIFPTSAFTIVNSPFGTAGGASTVNLVGPTIQRTSVYSGNLPQSQINALTGTSDFWRWRVIGPTFALPNFTTDGNVTVDWGDGVIETLTTGVHTFVGNKTYYDIGFRLNSGTSFGPAINSNATYKDRVIAVGPAPVSMKIDAANAFNNCTNLRAFDATVDVSGSTNLNFAWDRCSSLVSFPLINTANVTSMSVAWRQCSSLTSFPLINTSNVPAFGSTWSGCVGLKSFPLIDTSKATNFANAWFGCSGLTSFPLLNSSKVIDFTQAWDGCSGLLSFPALDTNKGTTFAQTWRSCAFTSFPLINTSSATTFQFAWNSCSNLTTFPANMFNTTGTLVATAFLNTFNNCALTAASIENILTSLVTNGQSNITLNLFGGTNAGASTWTANAIAAYNTLISRGWTITRNA